MLPAGGLSQRHSAAAGDLNFSLESSNQVNRSGRQQVLPRQYSSKVPAPNWCLANIPLSRSLVNTQRAGPFQGRLPTALEQHNRERWRWM